MSKQAIASIPARQWRGLVPYWNGGRLQVPLRCACGTEDHWSAAQMIGPDRVIPKIIEIGWSVDGKVTCPACIVMNRRGKMRLVPGNPQPIKEIVMAAEPKVQTEASDAAKRAKRLVYAALEDYYDDVAKNYREGHSDKRVSEELGVAEAFVRSIRESDYGPLSEPPEITSLREELKRLDGEMAKVRGRLDAICGKNGWPVAA